ncbi:hypothetical protein V8D89_014311 [Ganoderma adspersum]
MISAAGALASFLRPGTTTLASAPLLARARLVGRARIPWVAVRCISQSPAAQKAVTFGLNTGRAETAPANGVAHGESLRMIMFGKPGAGKGTLSSRLVKKYDIMSLSTGDLLRQHIAEKTEVGMMAEEIVAAGGLLPDEIMLKVVTSKLDLLHNKHWILDGFPRTLGQGKVLDEHLSRQGTPMSLVLNLDVPDDVILGRISDRWVHLPSGRVYNLSYNPPKVAGHDDDTGEPLTKRPDDNPEIFARRLEQFYASTSPLLAYYGGRTVSDAATKLITLTGRTSDEIWPQLETVIRTGFPMVKERQESKRRTSLSDAVLARQEFDSKDRVKATLKA